MTCEEALRHLYDVIDKEASQYDVEEVQKHLAECKSCMARYEFEEMFKAFVKDKAAPSDKADKLKSRILDKIDEESEGHSFGKLGPFRFSAVAIAAAVALVLCVGASFWAAGFYRYTEYVRPFEQNQERQLSSVNHPLLPAHIHAAPCFYREIGQEKRQHHFYRRGSAGNSAGGWNGSI